MSVRTYVTGTTNGVPNFTEQQQLVFNFLLNSFPEKLRTYRTSDDLVDYEDVLAVLALIASEVGNSRDLINNLQHIKDVPHLYDNIEDSDDLAENNKVLLLLNIEDIKNVLLDESISVERKLEIIDNNKRYFVSAYPYVSNRGSLSTLRKVITDYLLDRIDPVENTDGNLSDLINPLASSFTVEADATTLGSLVKIDLSIYADVNLNDPITGESGYFGIKTTSDLYKIIKSIRPAGIIYTIAMLFELRVLENLATPVFLSTHSDNSLITLVDTLEDEPSIAAVVDGTNYTGTIVTYTVAVTNPYSYTSIVLNVGDFTTAAGDKTESHHQITIGPGETIEEDLVTFNSYASSSVAFYIAGYYTIDSEETDYSTVVTLAAPASGGSTPELDPIAYPDSVAVAATWNGGGYVDLTIVNLNNVAVSASVSYTYTDVTGIKILSISAPGSITTKLYNPQSYISDCVIRVTLSATGYDDSTRITKTVSDVDKTYLAY